MTRAAGHLRRSTTKQEKSIDEQRQEIKQYAATHGLIVVRWCEDSISGATGEERPEFLRMVRDADTKRDFSIVLCWNSARFGRMGPDEDAHYRHYLTKAADNEPSAEAIEQVLRSEFGLTRSGKAGEWVYKGGVAPSEFAALLRMFPAQSKF